MKSVFLVCLLSLLASTQAAEFSFYIFASEWAGSACNAYNCNQDEGVSTEFWNIHGLWPSDGLEDIAYCTHEEFDLSQISGLGGDLIKYWSGLYNDADNFHAHEWTKHGTCSNMTQENYFSTTVRLAQHLAIFEGLKKNGISPGKAYDCSDIANAIRQEYGVNSFSIQADNGYLSAIQFCLDINLNLQDCPHGVSDDICKGEVKYPSFSLSAISQ